MSICCEPTTDHHVDEKIYDPELVPPLVACLKLFLESSTTTGTSNSASNVNQRFAIVAATVRNSDTLVTFTDACGESSLGLDFPCRAILLGLALPLRTIDRHKLISPPLLSLSLPRLVLPQPGLISMSINLRSHRYKACRAGEMETRRSGTPQRGKEKMSESCG